MDRAWGAVAARWQAAGRSVESAFWRDAVDALRTYADAANEPEGAVWADYLQARGAWLCADLVVARRCIERGRAALPRASHVDCDLAALWLGWRILGEAGDGGAARKFLGEALARLERRASTIPAGPDRARFLAFSWNQRVVDAAFDERLTVDATMLIDDAAP
jgi:hypothetical protein